MKPSIVVFATGSKEPLQGGSGFLQLVKDVKEGILKAEISAVVTPLDSSVNRLANEHGIKVFAWTPTLNARCRYEEIYSLYRPDLVVLAGWIKLVQGLDKFRALNIHPAPLPEFGGKGMYGLRVHEKVIASGRVTTAVTVHWVNEEYDKGDIIFERTILILSKDTPQSLRERVKHYEHFYYGRVINAVLQGEKNIQPSDFPLFSAH